METLRKVAFENQQEALALLGDGDGFLEIFRKNFPCQIISRGDSVEFAGDVDSAEKGAKALEELQNLCRRGTKITRHEVRYAIRLVKEGKGEELRELFGETILVTAKGRHIRPKTLGQQEYVEMLRINPVTFGIGPAGTGKTYLAVVMAAMCLRKKQVERIILTRPAVEAGERLGFLPGDLQEKVDPYLRPLYDALEDIFGTDTYQKFMGKGIIEIAPLAFMRGRTLTNSFVILDEGQNTTEKQMKMFLTRIGFNSRIAVTGDLSQIDLPRGVSSGLKVAVNILEGIEGIGIAKLENQDIIRSPIAGKIVEAYDRYESEKKEPTWK